MAQAGPKTHSKTTPGKELKSTRVGLHNVKSRYIVRNKLPGWHYCLINDSKEGYNLQRYLDAGYVFDNDESSGIIQQGETVHPTHSKQSAKSYATKQDNMRMYLMRIPEALRKEDIFEKNQKDDALMQTIFGDTHYNYMKNQTKMEEDTRLE